jgi:acetyl-CoA carboxylase beta subunit
MMQTSDTASFSRFSSWIEKAKADNTQAYVMKTLDEEYVVYASTFMQDLMKCPSWHLHLKIPPNSRVRLVSLHMAPIMISSPGHSTFDEVGCHSH